MGVQVEWGKSPHDTTSRSSSTPRWQPQQLSGGQMQQVTLTRALVKRPKLLLLDDRKSLRVSKMLLDHRLHDGRRADRALRQRHRVRPLTSFHLGRAAGCGGSGGKGPGTFDFLGFTMYWRRTRRGRWQMWCKTRSKGLRRFNRAVAEWCRCHRHLPVQDQHAALTRRLVGHFNYFGVNGNIRSLARVVYATVRVWRKWLRRRSQRTRLTWERFNQLLERFPLPRPRVVVRIWGA